MFNVFPIEQTCVNKLVWYDKNSDRGSNAINTRLENEVDQGMDGSKRFKKRL